ncbi:related to ubiquitin-conjugating enzyme E2 6 [Phialocephala subalpina]|uniref:Related to ubiquitin-conjugating enzyme E2 6 n=1 Tax=Phialocephala subalpina TaxID=576137 RepID=A0A1L7XRH5_9HELO|nr:related to ubiquitin-conjugating enzyme E2 6 [Phialocephala subalpina]
MATSRINSKSPTIKRIRKLPDPSSPQPLIQPCVPVREAAELANSPSPDFHAAPANDADLFDWHFTLRGPPSSSFAQGIYHGRIVLPPTYPLRPPSFRFLTPSGRFEVNREICLSISGHHEETWMPAWGVRTALTALRSFMETDPKGQLGGMDCSAAERERVAKDSGEWKCGICGRSNAEILRESEEAAKKEGSSAQEVEVPKELNMAWKDEMKPTAEQKEATEEDAALAEGFVRTGNDGAMDVPVANTAPAPYPAARPAQGVSQSTATTTTRPLPTYPAQAARRRTNDGVPIWIDRTIAAIVILLVAMIVKILLGM